MISIGRLKPARHDSSLVSDHLSSSQLPVWTIYAEKICVPTTSDLECQASWAFEMVSGEKISQRSEGELENCQFLAVEPAQFIHCYGLNTKIATLGRNVSKLSSFLFQLSGVL